MSARNDTSAVDLLAELVERLAAHEKAAQERHAEVLRALAQAEDSATCASLDASAAAELLRRVLDED